MILDREFPTMGQLIPRNPPCWRFFRGVPILIHAQMMSLGFSPIDLLFSAPTLPGQAIGHPNDFSLLVGSIPTLSLK